MKGSNEFRISQATMIEAVQQYLDTQFAAGKAPMVTSVEKARETYGGGEEFTIKTSEPDEQERRT